MGNFLSGDDIVIATAWDANPIKESSERKAQGTGIRRAVLIHDRDSSLARALSTFPVVFDGLQGHDIALEKGQIQATNVDDYLLRAYREPGTTPPLFLYIGYYKSQRVLKNVHTPRNCLPGSGWEPVTAT